MSGPGAQPPIPPAPNQPLDRAAWRSRLRIVPRRPPALPQPVRPLVFKGQNHGERVIWIKRQSRWFLLASGWPLLVGLVTLVAAQLWLTAHPTIGANLGAGARILLLLGWAALLIFAIRWAVTDFWNWFFLRFILTDQRVIEVKGFFHRDSREIVLKSVAQVLMERPGPLYVLFRVGDVQVRPFATPITLVGLDNPRDVADSIIAIMENPKYGLPQPAGVAGQAAQGAQQDRSHVRNHKLQAALDALAAPVPLPSLPPVYSPVMGGILHRRIPVRFIDGESVVEIVYRHWFVLLRRELFPIVLLLGGPALSFALHAGGMRGSAPIWLAVAGMVGGLILAGLTYLDYADDVFVLTTHRLIDIDRLIFLLAEYSSDAPYGRIQDVHVERNVVGKILGYGTIVVETSGRKYPLKMSDVPAAFQLMDRIFAQINLVRERDAATALNKQKKENYTWIATALNDLVSEVPDVRGQSIIHAASALRSAGLKLIVDMERPAPGVAPGIVLDQSPTPGSSALAESEAHVILSAHAPSAAPIPPLAPIVP